MPAESAVRVVVLFPKLLGTYGDGGNALVLRRRLVDRGLACDIVPVAAGAAIPADGDVYLLGGAEDARQAIAARLLRADSGLLRAVDRGAAVLAVCAGYQIIGSSFLDADGSVRPGLGLLDARTTRLPKRAVGDVVATAEVEPPLPVLLGFENHGGRTQLGPSAKPLGKVLTGVGNGEHRGTEGAVRGRVVGTYLHGPVLANNPALADRLLTTVVGPLPELQHSRTEELTTVAREERLSRSRQRRATRRAWLPRPIAPSAS